MSVSPIVPLLAVRIHPAGRLSVAPAPENGTPDRIHSQANENVESQYEHAVRMGLGSLTDEDRTK